MTAFAIHSRDTPTGLAYGLSAYVWWGVMPIYIWRIAQIPPGEILSFRIVTSLAVLAVLVVALRRGTQVVQAFRTPRIRNALAATAALIGINWYIYTYAVNTSQTVEMTLGYFLQPLLNVMFGVILFHERLRPWQIGALMLAMTGLIVLFVVRGQVPWIAFGVAISFGLYSVIRKSTPVDGLVGLTAEIIFLCPMAIAYLIYLHNVNKMTFGTVDDATNYWLLAGGFLTSIPMIFFGQAARRLRLSTLGFLQYISPSIQFVLALTFHDETVSTGQLTGYALVWIALAIYTFDSVAAMRSPADAVDNRDRTLSD